MKIIIATVSALILVGCTWVNENPRGESIAITTQDQITQCQRVGKINARTRAKVLFAKRGYEKVKKEIRTLAKNEALKIGANTLAPDGEIRDGKQTFIAYNCPR